ncbi:MAG: DUF2029 domain-containing protein [Ignavibacteria bacterium]|nr:DUF2029 domain-containing protein [Ignavibacteria bacterium]
MKNINKILLVICILLIGIFLFYSASRSGKLTHGFASYYTFSRILAEEGDISRAYDTTYFYQKLSAYGFSNIKDIANNPPGNSVMMLPAEWLDPLPAKKLWTVLSVMFFFSSLLLLTKTLGYPFKSNFTLVTIVIALIFYPVYNGIALGQAYALMLLLFSLSLYGVKHNRPWLTAIPLAAIIFIKSYGIIPLVFLLIMKKYREFFLTVLIVIAFILVTLPVFQVDAWQLYYNNVLNGFGTSILFANTANQTINGLVRHMFMFNTAKNPNAIIALSQPAIILLVYATSLLVITMIWHLVRKLNYNFSQIEPSPLGRAGWGNLLTFAAAISLNVVFAPVAEEYHYILFLPLIFIAGKYLIENYKRTNPLFIIFVLLFIILAAPVNYKSIQPYGFPVYLLAYPKLFAGLFIIFLSLFICKPVITRVE